MSPLLLVLLLIAGGVLLLIGELMLPTQGILGILGAISLLSAVGVSFNVNQWLAVGLLAGIMGMAPVAWSFAMKIYPNTPMGRRMVLQPVEAKKPSVPVPVGTDGRAITALRPMGECDFSGTRLEAHSELGVIEAGKTVKVVAIDAGRLIVRAI